MASQLFNLQKAVKKPETPAQDFPVKTDLQPMSDPEFNELKDMIYQLTGILFTESKKYLLEGRILKRVTANYMRSFGEYIRFVKSPGGRLELNALIDIVTINETFFFRGMELFEAFEKEVVPDILKNRPVNGVQVFNIWSAASSTGEEPYTLAMIINERLKPMYPNVVFRVVGSDINKAVLDTARKGIYKEYAIKNMPPYFLNKYFTKVDSMYHLNEDIKRMVRFTSINLYDPNAVKAMNCTDVIFCANVLIYFDYPSKEKVVSYLYDALNKGGYLFIGNAESLHGVSKAFRLLHFHKATAYKKD